MTVTSYMRTQLKQIVKPRVIALFGYRPLRKVIFWRLPAKYAPEHVALTFDDGPHPEYTPQALDLLAKFGIRATFFVLGSSIENNPDIFRRILDEGHEFGIHGYVHTNDELDKQILRTLDVVHQFGVSSSLFRPPHGILNWRTSLWMMCHGFTTVLWSFDCRDSMRYEGKGSGRKSLDEIGPGDIVLLHDDNPVCLSDFESILETIKTKRLKTCIISEMLAAT
jgi:peptidoglycan-N-acetylglucosamine deacetylase